MRCLCAVVCCRGAELVIYTQQRACVCVSLQGKQCCQPAWALAVPQSCWRRRGMLKCWVGNAILKTPNSCPSMSLNSRKETSARWNDTDVFLVPECLCFSSFFFCFSTHKHTRIWCTTICLTFPFVCNSNGAPLCSSELTQHLCTLLLARSLGWTSAGALSKSMTVQFYNRQKATFLGFTITFEHLVFHCGRRFPITESTMTYELDELLEMMYS